MRKYPFSKQENSNDCGIACLQMIIRYYKGNVPKSLLTLITHTNKNGTTAYHMVEALKQLGFEAYGVSCPLIEEKMMLPCIAHVTLNQSYGHYVVIYEIDYKKSTILIGDPASQLQKMNLDTFRKIYNQVAIILYPIQKIPIYHPSFSMITYTLKIIGRYFTQFLPISILSIFIFGLSLFGTFYLQVLSSTNFHNIQLLFIFFLSLEILKHFFSYIRNILIQHLQQKLSSILTIDAFSKIMKLPYAQYLNLPTGDFLSRMQDIVIIQETVASLAFTILFDCFLFLLSIFFLLWLQPVLCIICLFLSIGYLFIMFHFRKIHQKNIIALERENVNVQTYLSDYMHAFEMIKGLSITDKVIRHFQKQHQKYTNCLFTFQKKIYKEELGRCLLESFGSISFLIIGIYFYRKENISLELVFAYQLLFSYIMTPIIHFVDSNFLIERAKRAIERINSLVSLKEKCGIKTSVIECIQCKDFNYAYLETPILKNINLMIKKGAKILCIGPSGSGKSTLFKCLKGYYPSNQIYINHLEMTQYHEETFNQILYVSQNERLVLGSVLDNIVMLDEIDSKVLNEILELCEIDKLVEENPLKYHMLVEENGCNFSGGQRAQIVIARTLLKQAQVLLIDEGFSQMDVALERRILMRIFEKYPHKTIAVISHRSDNKDLYDQVIALKEGKIVEV